MKILALNVRGIECNGRTDQIQILLKKYQVSVAILSECETNHDYASTTHLEGYRAFCPPRSVSGPSGKECGVIMMVSTDLASSSILRPDINGKDTVNTVWTEVVSHNLLIGGVYRRNRPSQPEVEREELNQLSNQVLKAVHTGKTVILLGDVNLDHSNPDHKKKNEASELLSVINAANMKHLKTGITWKSDGLYKKCQCPIPCKCPKSHRTGTIDNVYISQSEKASVEVLTDSLSDHFPLLIRLKVMKLKRKVNSKQF